jgi:hypothetical protein
MLDHNDRCDQEKGKKEGDAHMATDIALGREELAKEIRDLVKNFAANSVLIGEKLTRAKRTFPTAKGRGHGSIDLDGKNGRRTKSA